VLFEVVFSGEAEYLHVAARYKTEEGPVVAVNVRFALGEGGEAMVVGETVDARAFEPVLAVELLHDGCVVAFLVHTLQHGADILGDLPEVEGFVWGRALAVFAGLFPGPACSVCYLVKQG